MSTIIKEYEPRHNESNPEMAFVDLASFGVLENSLYNVNYSTKSYFTRETIRSTWFTQIPIRLRLDTTSPDFGQHFTAEISRNGDYLLQAWLRVTLNAVEVYEPTPTTIETDGYGDGKETISWTPNFMHNLIETCSLKANGLIIDELFSEHLDFLAAFMIPKNSRAGYNRMIGNFTSPDNGLAGVNVNHVNLKNNRYLNTDQELFLPLPFFFSKDSGMALPMAAIPYADVKIHFKFRKWEQLMVSMGDGYIYDSVNIKQLNNKIPKLSNVQVWGNYSLVSKKERRLMGCKRRDIVMEQNQQLNGTRGSAFLNGDSVDSTTSIDLRLNGSVKAIFFGCKDLMNLADNPYRSVYSSGPNVNPSLGGKVFLNGSSTQAYIKNSSGVAGLVDKYVINWVDIENMDNSCLCWDFENNVDPVGTACILYENTIRTKMENNYYSLIQPFYHANNIPLSENTRNRYLKRNSNEISGISQLSIGYHMYSYSLNVGSVDPCGSTNYGNLVNSTLVITPSKTTVNLSAFDDPSIRFGPWRVYVSAINHNILRIDRGTLGFPII